MGVGCPIRNGAAHSGKVIWGAPPLCAWTALGEVAEVAKTAAVLGYTQRRGTGLVQVDWRAEKSPEVLLLYQLPGGQGRALRGSVIAGIPQT